MSSRKKTQVTAKMAAKTPQQLSDDAAALTKAVALIQHYGATSFTKTVICRVLLNFASALRIAAERKIETAEDVSPGHRVFR